VGCATTGKPPKATLGAIAGLVRDHGTGDPVAMAEIKIGKQGAANRTRVTSNNGGLYDLDKLPPGRYDVNATFAGQPLRIRNVDVKAGETTYVDLLFTLGHPDPIDVDYGDPNQGKIDRYKPRRLAPTASLIEGTVSDLSTKERVYGAVVTAIANGVTEQTISDEHGRYRFESVTPGTYTVSAYYSVMGHGTIEVQRNSIEVAAAEAVVVPLWIEMAR